MGGLNATTRQTTARRSPARGRLRAWCGEVEERRLSFINPSRNGGSSNRIRARFQQDLIAAAGLPADVRSIHNRLPGAEALLELMRQDKKAQGGRLVFVLVRDIGDAFIARDVEEGAVLDFLREELA